MTSLDLETIQKLLKDDNKVAKDAVTSKHPRPIQIGPLRWKDTADRCANRGCSAPTMIRVQGIPYCTTHALYALNYIVIQSHSDYEDQSFTRHDCTCNAGKHSMMNIHSADCPIYERVKGNGLDDHTS